MPKPASLADQAPPSSTPASDPNLSGSAPTEPALDVRAGIMDAFMDNEDYKTFLFGSSVAQSRLLSSYNE